MNAPITVTATVPVWLMPHHSIDALLHRTRKGEPLTDMLSFWTWDLSKSSDPYTRIGEAQITINFVSSDEMVQSRIQSLRNEIDAARSAFLQKQKDVLEQISKLQALTNEVEA
jgi:ssRNA-specific RNase YbeY (16S rRNA maturation enzyme)